MHKLKHQTLQKYTLEIMSITYLNFVHNAVDYERVVKRSIKDWTTAGALDRKAWQNTKRSMFYC